MCSYQDPTEADKLAKIQKDLDETKVRDCRNLISVNCAALSGILRSQELFFAIPSDFVSSSLFLVV
jgi:hypothetical protein